MCVAAFVALHSVALRFVSRDCLLAGRVCFVSDSDPHNCPISLDATHERVYVPPLGSGITKEGVEGGGVGGRNNMLWVKLKGWMLLLSPNCDTKQAI